MIMVDFSGYDLCNVTKKKLEKEGFLSELLNEDANIEKEIINILDNNGCVLGVEKDKMLKGVYLFELNGKVLTFKNKIYTKETNDKIQSKFEKMIIEELKEKLTFEELEKIDWDEIEIVPKKKEGFSFLVFFICVALGIVFDNIGMGILWGFVFGITTRVAIVKKKEK